MLKKHIVLEIMMWAFFGIISILALRYLVWEITFTEQRVAYGFFLAGIISLSSVNIYNAIIKYSLTTWNGVCHHAEQLQNTSRMVRWRAVQKLSICFGQRFGHPSLFPKRKLDKCVSLWAKWWQSNKESIRWDTVIEAYVESDSD